MFVTDDYGFSLVKIEFQFHTVHPLLNRTTYPVNCGVKIPRSYWLAYLGIIGVELMCDLKT